jgi:hypothetical protein
VKGFGLAIQSHGRPPVPRRTRPAAGMALIVILYRAVASAARTLRPPGSSLIVSDYGISKETGKGTDFIVVMQ